MLSKLTTSTTKKNYRSRPFNNKKKQQNKCVAIKENRTLNISPILICNAKYFFNENLTSVHLYYAINVSQAEKFTLVV